MFDALAAMSDEWTTFYDFVLALKTIVIGLDQADDWKCLKDMHGHNFYSSHAPRIALYSAHTYYFGRHPNNTREYQMIRREMGEGSTHWPLP
uniref:Uncharacterized protein n=1 Tax=Romanomermis culicivorax TaxID=13658 RepID=A0A915I1M0_ROMCU